MIPLPATPTSKGHPEITKPTLFSSIAKIQMSSKIYYVQRHDFQDWEDETGRVHFQSAHATLALANTEAQELLHYILEEEDDYQDGAEIGQDEIQQDGFFKGTIVRVDDEDDDEERSIDLCVITVEETVLHGGIVKPIGDEHGRKRARMDGDEEVSAEDTTPEGETSLDTRGHEARRQQTQSGP